MTENRRFYYNTFYHADDMSRILEYEIIDRQSYPNYPHHDEKEDIPNWCIYIGENDSGWQDMLVELLNALHEENERLKQELQKIYDVATLKKARDIVDKVYDDLLYETSEESDYARNKVLECLERLDEFGDGLE